MKKTLSVAFLLAFFGFNVLARSSANLTVHVISETEDSARVAKAVSARIDSTARYTIVDSKSLLSLDIMCFEIEKIINNATQGMDGYVCYHSVVYRPPQLAPFESVLGTQQFVDREFINLELVQWVGERWSNRAFTARNYKQSRRSTTSNNRYYHR